MSSSPKTSSSSSDFVSILDAALSEYNKKTGKDLLGQPLTADLGRCASVDDILTILQHHANAFEQFRRGDHRLMKWIGSSVHVFDALSATFSESIGLAFPPAKAIFVGIGVLLSVAKDVRESHDVLVGLFERIGDFFRRFSVYVQNSPAIELAEVLVKVVVEVLRILSIATKEMEQSRTKTYFKKLVGRTDIEDALKRLENLIQEEHRMATAQVLRDTGGLKDDVETVRITVQQIADNTDEVKWEQTRQSVRKWFSPPDPSTNHNIACEAFHEKTATWFFEGNMFMDWMSIGSLLWIHGKPGSGKSVLCSAIIQRIMEFRKTKPASLAYFYFDFRDKDKQNVRKFVTSLLIQLSAHSTSCCDVLSRVYSEHGNGAQQPSNGVLISCLKKMLRVSAEHPVYIIVDALDECPDLSGMPTQREAVLDLVEGLVRQHLPNLHICVTSRTEIDIKTRLEPLASNAVSLHDESGQKKDISDYVSSVMYSDRKLQRLRDEDKKLAVELLSEKADGMFRWVFCQLEVLRHTLSRNVRRVLDELPKSLDETYERVLKDINENNQEHARRLLHCLAVAMRPLRVEELAEILAFDFDVAEEDIPEFHADWRWKDQEQAVLSTCSSLIAIVDNNGSQVVQFSHFSVKEFLTSNRLATSTEDISRYHVLPKPAHIILARACLGFLLHLDDHTDDEASKGFPLAKYAAQHWVAHAQFEDVTSHVKDGMESLFDLDKPHFAAWVRIHNIDPPIYWGSQSPSKSPNPLYYSSLCGFHDLVEHLAGKHPKHLNAIGGRYQSPLLAALRGRHILVAKILLKHGGNVDVRGMRNQTPLHNAIIWSHHAAVEAVQFLLEHGADVNARQGDLGTPLHLAADIGALEVVQILLEQNADIDSRNNKGQTPLHLVSRREVSQREHNRRNLVQLLLEKGADINARDMEHETPLHFASYHGRVEIARALLDRGASVNMKNHRGLTPLHLVLEKNCDSKDAFDFALLLLEHGADADARYKDHGTLLHFASYHGRIELAQLLLDHGANANTENERGQKPLHLVLEGHYNSQDAFALALQLMERGADVNAQDNDHATPLHVACYLGKLEMARVLLDHGANADAQNSWGQTPLQLVLQRNHDAQDGLALARLLLTHGADVNMRDKDHIAPLIFAVFHGKVEMVRMLLEHGANANERNEGGQTPLHIVCDRDPQVSQDGPDLALLLLKRGADVNARDNFLNTPLHIASYNGRLEMVWVLLDHDANANAEDDRSQTPLHLVSGIDHDSQVALTRLLLRRGANANAQDTDHITPLHLASYHGRFEIVQALLDHGANADATNDRRQTPLHLVSQGEYVDEDHGVETAKLLLERGVDADALDNDQANALHLALLLGRPKIVQILLEYGAGAITENNE